MLFPPAFVERIKTHFLLSDLIGKRIALKRTGKEYGGLCPFHGEKTPSFTVNNEKGFYHCFGCGAHGDAISFVMNYERLSYPEAIESLAREAGIALPERVDSQEIREKEQRRKSLIDAMEEAAQWFERNLQLSDQVNARDYLHSRGLAVRTQREFRIGVAPEGREGLKKHLLGKGFEEAQLIEAGLLIRPESGASYDRFRARLMFPIRDVKGRVIAFGGRLMGNAGAPPGKHAPKYLNSPETPLFHKSEVLFNLDKAGAVAREKNEIIIVEGYMDVIAMAQAGFGNAVATLGTAVTEQHVQKLWQYTRAPVLCLDGDAAGVRAMLRAAELVLPLLKPDYSLRFARLPKGEDPDSLIRHGGAGALARALGEASELSQMLWHHFSAEAGHSAESRAALEHKLMGMAAGITHPTVRNHFRSYFRREMWDRTFGKGEKAAPQRLRSVQVERHARAGASETQLRSVRCLLKIVLLQPALLHESEVEEYFSRMDCVNPALEGLKQAMLDTVFAFEGTDATRDALQAALLQAGFGHAVSALLKDEGLLITTSPFLSLRAARHAWRQSVQAASLAELEQEHAQLESEMGISFDDHSLQRMMELQKQIHEHRKKRNFAVQEEE